MREVLLRDPNDRDRQQRALTAELRHAADLHAARKRREEQLQRDDAQTEAHTARDDQRQTSCHQPLPANEIRDWAADGATQTTGDHVADPTPRPR